MNEFSDVSRVYVAAVALENAHGRICKKRRHLTDENFCAWVTTFLAECNDDLVYHTFM